MWHLQHSRSGRCSLDCSRYDEREIERRAGHGHATGVKDEKKSGSCLDMMPGVCILHYMFDLY